MTQQLQTAILDERYWVVPWKLRIVNALSFTLESCLSIDYEVTFFFLSANHIAHKHRFYKSTYL